MVAANTWFQKSMKLLVTYKEKDAEWAPANAPAEYYNDPTKFVALDYVLCQKRWRNAVVDISSVHTCPVASDHLPLLTTFRIKGRGKARTKTSGPIRARRSRAK